MSNLTEISDEKLVAVYRKLRSDRDAAKKEFTEAQAPTLAAMQKLEVEAQRRLLERGSTSFKTDAGTCYSKDDTSVTIPNKTAYLDWIKEHDQWDLLDVRPGKKEVMNYMENTGEVPPGLDVNIRKKVAFNAPRNS